MQGDMTIKIEEKYYGICLDDYALPSICSGTKMFYGTISQIKALISTLSNDFEDTIVAFSEFKQGNFDVTHTVAYNKQKLLQPIEVIAYEKMNCPSMQWDHRNVWDCIYSMRAEAVQVEQILIFHNGKYIRAAKPNFTNLQYRIKGSPERVGWKDIGSFWGFPNMLTWGGDQIKCTLFVEEQMYNDPETAKKDMGKTTKLEFTQAINEIFADG